MHKYHSEITGWLKDSEKEKQQRGEEVPHVAKTSLPITWNAISLLKQAATLKQPLRLESKVELWQFSTADMENRVVQPSTSSNQESGRWQSARKGTRLYESCKRVTNKPKTFLAEGLSKEH